MKILSLILLLLPSIALADKNEILLNELGFIDTVKSARKARIVEQLGEPARSYDVTDKSGAIFGAIWHYHYINTSEQGDYYKTTELDFIGDSVVTVVFSNNDPEADEAAVYPAAECTALC